MIKPFNHCVPVKNMLRNQIKKKKKLDKMGQNSENLEIIIGNFYATKGD